MATLLPHRQGAIALASLLSALLPCVVLSGCQGGDGFSPEPPGLLAPPTTQQAADTDKDIAGWAQKYYQTTGTDQASADQRKDYRNKIIRRAMGEIDARFSAFDEELAKNRNLSDFGFDMVNMGLGFTGAIVGGVETKTVTNALVTVITGSKSAISADFYNQQTAIAISAKMRELRSEQAVTIANNLKKDDGEYPLYPDAVADLQEYFSDGTVLGALRGITKDAGANTDTSKTDLSTVQAQPATKKIIVKRVAGRGLQLLNPDGSALNSSDK